MLQVAREQVFPGTLPGVPSHRGALHGEETTNSQTSARSFGDTVFFLLLLLTRLFLSH